MQIIPLMDMNLRRAIREVAVLAVCQNPGLLRSHLINLEAQLSAASETLAMIEVTLVAASDVRLARFLLPFLRGAEGFFRYAEQRIPEFLAIVQRALPLVGAGPADPTANQILYQCQDAARIRTNLRRMEQSLARVQQSLRQMAATYDADAAQIYQIIQRRIDAPVPPPEPDSISAPQRPRMPSVAEQTALASVALLRREVGTDLLLVRQALQEIVSPIVQRIPGIPIRP
ncbi:MAG TPA: hypothetical protein VNT75_32230 [Symbiobacteriaceae bacterium]|nr:hypothetical protein [Symbiobacteriaceae bacterium]